MERKTLNISVRGAHEVGRKGANNRLRMNARIPAVIYGHAKSLPVSVDEKEFVTKFHRISENTIIQLDGDEAKHDVLVRDFQTEVMTGRIIHIDFYEIEQGRLLHTRVPVHLAGSPIGVREGGILEVFLHEFEVECLPQDIPADIEIDIVGLAIGHSIHVGEISLPAGVRVLNPKEQVVCLVQVKKAEAAPAEEEAATAAEAAETPEEAE